ncbi:hypothetical protein [Paludisphaera sp.]|uniref:hypothetical protein n=1 Tax=Paludisphaera sp. TaxID=2017432 RepID=UPI00301D0FA4
MMRFGRRALAALGLLLATSAAQGDPPKLTDIAPIGVRRGEAVEVTLTGERLGANPRLIAAFPFQLEPLPPERSKPEAWAFKLTVPESVAVGAYPIRVQTDDGLSAPLLLPIGQLPRVAEAEENNRIDVAQAVTVPAVVEGRVAGNDVDCFRFAGTKGQRIVVDARCARIGSGVDPTIRLSQVAPARRFVAAAEDTPGLLTDARLFVELPEDGDYVVELSDARYAGGGRPVYLLVIGEVPAAAEVFPLGGREGETVGFELIGGTLAEPRPVAARVAGSPPVAHHVPRFNAGGLDFESLRPLAVSRHPEVREPADPAAPPIRVVAPVVVNGRIETPGDEDRYVVATRPGSKLRVRVDAAKLGSSLDGWLQALNPQGAAIATADDQSTPGPTVNGVATKVVEIDPAATVDVPAGVEELTLVIRDNARRGGEGFGYRIVVEPATPDFALTLDPTEANVPRGGSRTIGVTVAREGYDGPIALSVADPPPGVTFRPGSIAAGQALGRLSLTAAADASFDAADLKVIGEGQGPGGPIRRVAQDHEVFAMLDTLAANVLRREALATAPSTAEVVAVDAPAGPIEVAHGQSATIPVKLARTEGADAAVALNALPLAPGFTAAAVNVAEKADAADFAVAVAPEASLGVTTVGLSAKGKFADVERTVEGPVVALSVVRPVELTLEQAAVEVVQGATAEVKGKLVRKGSFKDPVVVKLDGLPAGLTAEPVTVAPEAVDFVVKLSAAADAAPAEAAATVVPAFQVAGKDYPHPPAALATKVVAPAK